MAQKKKYIVYLNDEILVKGMTLFQALDIASKLRKMFPTCSAYIDIMKEEEKKEG